MKKLLIRAKELISGGWCQRSYHDYDGRYCLSGALFQASDELVGSSTFVSGIILEDFVKRFITDGSIPAWNDQSGRTVEDVLNVLDQAIKVAA